MAASFITLVGAPNAVSKSKPTHPLPRLTGSETTRPPWTGAGTPTETASQRHPSAVLRAAATISVGVNVGPDGARRLSASPFTSTLTCDPPTSTARTARSSTIAPPARLDRPARSEPYVRTAGRRPARPWQSAWHG